LLTKYLLTELGRPQSVKETFEQVRAQVYQASAKKQLPALYDMVVGRLMLRKDGEMTPEPEPGPDPARVSSVTSVKAPGKTKVNPKDGLTYVWIPPGQFTMGCSPGDRWCFLGDQP